jgi:hypothetical protein
VEVGPTQIDYMTEFLIDGIRFGIELKLRGENLTEDVFVQQRIEQQGGPYVLHRALISRTELPLEGLTSIPRISTRV